MDEPDLRVPHALLGQRLFVLVPLAEVTGDYVHPEAGLRIASMRELCPAAERAEVVQIRGPEWAAG